VHHGKNPKYIDKNFGGVLIVWDKIFGTFQTEEERPQYGLTKPIYTNNPIKIIFHEWCSMFSDVAWAHTRREKLLCLLGKPGLTINTVIQKIKLPTLLIVARAVAFAGVICLTGGAYSQTAQQFIDQGQFLEKRFEDQAAYEKYQKALLVDPNNTFAMVRSSRMLCNIGGRSTNKKLKKSLAQEAEHIALKVIRIDDKNTDAHLCYILSLGILSEMADGSREKLENAKIIKREADFILSLDPSYAPAYYILGKWHHALASLNAFERLACNLLFGGVPEGASMNLAIQNYEMAIQLWPDYILFYYSQAMSLHWLGDNQKTIIALEKAISLPPKDQEDPVRLEKCRTLLEKAKSVNL
jgi:tetratricopeptide (TPR) repeat protein